MKIKYYYHKILRFRILDVKTMDVISNPTVKINNDIVSYTTVGDYVYIVNPCIVSGQLELEVSADGYNDLKETYQYIDLNNSYVTLIKKQGSGEININLTWYPPKVDDFDLYLHITESDTNKNLGTLSYSSGNGGEGYEDSITIFKDGVSYLYTLDYDDDYDDDPIKDAHTENITGKLCPGCEYRIEVRDASGEQLKNYNAIITITYNNSTMCYQCTEHLKDWENVVTIKEDSNGVWQFIPGEYTQKINQ